MEPELDVDALELARARARARARQQQAPATPERTVFSNLARGAMQGLGTAGTSTVGAIGTLTGSGRLRDWADRSEAEMREFYDPQGTAGRVGEIGGRVLGEIGAGVVGGTAGVKMATRASSRVARALEGASRTRRAGATMLANAPIDVVQGAKEDEGLLLPGRAGAIAENVGITGLAGALLPAARSARSAEVLDPPAQRQLPAGQYEMGPATVTSRDVPETDPRRMLPSRSQGIVPDQRELAGPAIPLTASADELTLDAARANDDDIARYRESRNRGVVLSRAGNTARRPTSIQRAMEAAERDAISAADVRSGVAASKFPPSLRKLSDDDLRATALDLQERLERTIGEANILNESEAINFTEAFGTSPIGYKGAKRLSGTAEDARRLRDFSEEQIGRLDELGLTPADIRTWKDAQRRLPTLESQFARLTAEMDKRGLSFVDDATEFPFGANRIGAINPQLLGTAGGAAAGAVVGGATSPDGEDAFGRIGRALTGAAVGAGVGRVATRSRPATPRGAGATPVERVRATINTGVREANGNPAWLTPQERAYTDLISETFPLVKAARAAAGQAGADRMQGVIAQMHGHQRAAHLYLEDTIGEAIQGSKEVQDDVRVLLKARRDLDIRRRGGAAKSAASEQDLADAVATLSQNPRVVQSADAVTAMHRDLLTKRYEAGLLTEDAYRAILDSEDFYTPFVREFAEEAMARGASGGRLSVRTSGVSRMDRTAEGIANTADPLEVAVAAAQRTYRDVAKQRIQNVLTEFADADALPFIKRVTGDVPPNAMTYTQIVNGKPVKYQVTDREVFDLLTGIDAPTTNIVMKMAQAYTRFGRAAITMMPDFAIANVIRDMGQTGPQRMDVARGFRDAAVGAGVGGVAGAITDGDDNITGAFLRGAGLGAGAGAFARPMARTLKAMGEVAGNSEAYKDYIRAGGSTEGFNVRTPKDAQEALRQLERSGVSLSDVVSPKRWVDALNWIGSVGEQSPRLAAFKEARGSGLEAAQSAFLAQDRSLRFRNVGRSTKDVASVTKFWNAKVQGWDKLARMVRDPKTAGLAATMITAPTVSLWYANKDNPEYWNRPGWERNLFWLVPKSDGEGFYRIPKPFEFGYLFASLPERVLDFMAQRGTIPSAAGDTAEPGQELGRSVRDMAGATMEGTLPIPDALSTGLQLMDGRDWFRQRNIVSRPNLPTEMQVGDRTSAVARQAGRVGLSPEKVDFAIQDATGSAGRVALRATDAVARQVGADAPSTVADAPRNPLVPSRFQTRQYQMTDRESAARDRLRALDQTWAGYQETLKGGDPQAVERYERTNRRALETRAALDGARIQLDRISDQRRVVLRNPTIAPERKREIIEEMREAADNVARSIQSYRAGRQ